MNRSDALQDTRSIGGRRGSRLGDVQRLTLDTMLLQDYWKQRPRRAVTEPLLELARAGGVDLAVTARIREDVPNEPLATEVNRLSQLKVEETGSITRLGYWVLGRDRLGRMSLRRMSKSWTPAVARARRSPTGAILTTCTHISLRNATSS
jgi:hypothetical protein